jgi:trans-aconitate 2-methyltransferase
LQFEDERTRPVADLVARIPLAAPRRCIDIGCGPANSTQKLVERFPDAEVEGLDSSPDMLASARRRLPDVQFALADLSTWTPTQSYDVILANAVLQWLPDHPKLYPRLAAALAPGGCLAVQVPDNLEEPTHRLMREVAAEGPWAAKLGEVAGARSRIGSFDEHYAWLVPSCDRIDVWRTTYVHPLDGAAAIVEWLKGTGLRPFLDPLDEAERQEFLARYEQAIAAEYPLQADGRVLLRFPRLFVVAKRRAS